MIELLGIFCAAIAGGVGAWAAIRVDVALARHDGKNAIETARRAHVRIDDHVERHHTKNA